jgi:tetratricopeptide (TPR) repeat protein
MERILTWFLFLLFLLPHTVQTSGQERSLEDSLKMVPDKEKITILQDWIKNHPYDNEQNLQYADQIISLAQKLKDPESEVLALKDKGSSWSNLNDEQKALEFYQQALDLANEIDYQEGISACLYNIGIIYRSQNDYQKALDYFQQSLEIDSLSGNKENIASSLNIIGVVLRDMGNSSEALDYFARSFELNDEIGNQEGIAVALLNIGDIYSIRGDYERAEQNFVQSKALSEELNDKQGIARAYNALGNIFERRSELGAAQENYLEALKIYEEIADLRGTAQAQFNIGTVYKAMHNYDMSKQYFTSSLGNYMRLQNQEGIANCYLEIGYIQEVTENYPDAIRFYETALGIEQKLENVQGISYALKKIGDIYDKGLNDYDGALEYYMQALEMKHEIGDTAGIVNTMKTIGYVHQKYGHYSAALDYLNQSLELAKVINDKGLLRTIYRILSEFYAARGDYKNALEAFEYSAQYKDSVFTEESQQAIAQMQTLYDTEKKEQENTLLRKENEIQTLQISRQRNLRNSLLAISGLVLILVIVVYSRYRTKKKANELLNQKNILLEEQKNQIEEQKIEIEIKNQHITDSINYAKGIQDAMLPRIEVIKEAIPDLFIFYRPRDIVSGDFYWFNEVNGKIVIAAVDCTGHGVPGGFVSMMGNDLLNEIVDAKEITEADKILNELHKGVSKALKQQENQNRDGMDMALCVLDKGKGILEFAGAKNPLVYIQDEEVHRVIADKMPIGGIEDEELQEKIFTKHEFELKPDKVYYMFSDGYPDQFGGENKKKYMAKPFRELLLSIHKKPFDKQKEILETTFVEWMGDEPQVDDVLVMGFKV